jgi:hypothetical protein
MTKNTGKQLAVSFKVEPELASMLNGLQNKSDFIRKAIMDQFAIACPLCAGRGFVLKAIRDHFAPLIEAYLARACAHCRVPIVVPADPGALVPDDRPRLQQFFQGGPLYCVTCYRAAQLCEQCGWHIDAQQIPQHVRAAHAGRKRGR